MIAAGQSLLWQIWRRNRWGFAISAAYLLSAAAIIQSLPPEWLAMTMGDDGLPIVASWLGMPALFILLHVLAVFATTDAGLKDSGYALRMFTLPLSTRALAAWPILTGCLTMLAAWLAIAPFIWRPAGASAPLFWPGAAAALMLAAMQLISWLPLAQTWLRLVMLVPLLAILLSATLLKLVFRDFSEVWTTCMLLLPLPILYLAAEQALAMARRGDVIDWRAWRQFVARLAAWRKLDQRPFGSAGRAQHWFEWRGHGWVLPASLAALTPVIGPVVASADRTDVDAGWRFLAIVAALPPVFAFAFGGQLGKQDVWSGYAMSPFMAARPISTTRLIGAKLRMCLTSTLAGFCLALFWASLLLTRPGFAASIGQVAQTTGVLKFSGILLAAALGLIFVTWLQLAANMWITLTGRVWLILVFSNLLAAMIGIGILGGLWIYFHQGLHGYVRAAEPWAIAVLLGLKGLAALAVLCRLVQRRLVNLGAAVIMLLAWIAVTGSLWGAVVWVAPTGIVPPAELAAAISLLVPFSRLAGAALALDWNRHR